MTTDNQFKIPEVASNIGSGVLSEIWYSEGPLPKLRGYQLLFYYLKKGVDTVLALPMSNGIAITTIAISLFLFAGFFLGLQNIDRIIAHAGSSLYVTAYLKDNPSEAEVNELVRYLENNSQVRSVEYVSKEQALATFQEELGVRASFLDGLKQGNPLPASLELILFPDELKIGGGGIIENLRSNLLVDEVLYGSEWVDHMHRLLRIFRGVGYMTLAIILIVIVFLIANTIKLVIYSRSDEIAIMQLVGATDAFVKIPFVIGGTVQGILGSLCGLVLLRIVYSLLSYEFQYSTLFGIALPGLQFLTMPAIAVMIILGLLVGAIGSFVALGRFMNV